MEDKEFLKSVCKYHQLRVKIKYLAEESKIIKFEKTKTDKVWIKDDLELHRRDVVKPHARNAQLALAFFSGKEYSEVERQLRFDLTGKWALNPPDFTKVKRNVMTFSNCQYDKKLKVRLESTFDKWANRAQAHINEQCNNKALAA